MLLGRDDLKLIEEIEEAAVDGGPKSIAKALRKCLLLGGRFGSQELRKWARAELEGYAGGDIVPAYRKISSLLLVDGRTFSHRVTGYEVPSFALPDFAQEMVTLPLKIVQPIGEVCALVESGTGSVKFSPPEAASIAAIMNQSGNGENGLVIDSLYWSVPTSTLRGVLEVVASKLVDLMAELRNRSRSDEEVPLGTMANQAFGFVVHGDGNSVNVVTNSENSLVQSPIGAHSADPRFSRWVTVTAGLATVSTACVALGIWVFDIWPT